MTDKAKPKRKKTEAQSSRMQEKGELSVTASDAGIMTALQLDGIELPNIFTRDILLMHTMVNGCMYVKNIHRLAKQLKSGDRVSLVLEPDNPADSMAILVRDRKNRKIGYIPRSKNEVLFHLMDAGKYLYGVVAGGDIGDAADADDKWIEIYIDVFMTD